MNRQGRREFSRRTKKAFGGATTVLLVGGPMAGWHVAPDAPVLQEGWAVPDSWPHGPGRYLPIEPDGTQERAKWKPL